MIVVFGSINIDLITRVERLPAPGETALGPRLKIAPGGKGANQALAARRAGGAEMRLVGRVGRDLFAGPALALLEAGGVDVVVALISPSASNRPSPVIAPSLGAVAARPPACPVNSQNDLC